MAHRVLFCGHQERCKASTGFQQTEAFTHRDCPNLCSMEELEASLHRATSRSSGRLGTASKEDSTGRDQI
jgi:hypothetical protein